MKKFIVNIEVEFEVPLGSNIKEDDIAEGYRSAFEKGVLFSSQVYNVKESVRTIKVVTKISKPPVKENEVSAIIGNIQAQIQFLAEMFNSK